MVRRSSTVIERVRRRRGPGAFGMAVLAFALVGLPTWWVLSGQALPPELEALLTGLGVPLAPEPAPAETGKRSAQARPEAAPDTPDTTAPAQSSPAPDLAREDEARATEVSGSARGSAHFSSNAPRSRPRSSSPSPSAAA